MRQMLFAASRAFCSAACLTAIHGACSSFSADDGAAATDGGSDAAMTPDSSTVGDSAAPDGSLPRARVVFVTSTGFAGSALGGVGGGDAKCQSLATASKHAGVTGKKFFAWLSGTGVDAGARTREGGGGPFVRPDGTQVAASPEALVDGTLDAAIDIDERGTPVSGTERVWTGTTAAGVAAADTCGDWGESVDGLRGMVGAIGPRWTADFKGACAARNERLYCIEK